MVTVGATNLYEGNIDTAGDVTIVVVAGGSYTGNVEADGEVNITFNNPGGVYTGNVEADGKCTVGGTGAFGGSLDCLED